MTYKEQLAELVADKPELAHLTELPEEIAESFVTIIGEYNSGDHIAKQQMKNAAQDTVEQITRKWQVAKDIIARSRGRDSGSIPVPLKRKSSLKISQVQLSEFLSSQLASHSIVSAIKQIESSIGTILPAETHIRLQAVTKELENINRELKQGINPEIRQLYQGL